MFLEYDVTTFEFWHLNLKFDIGHVMTFDQIGDERDGTRYNLIHHSLGLGHLLILERGLLALKSL